MRAYRDDFFRKLISVHSVRLLETLEYSPELLLLTLALFSIFTSNAILKTYSIIALLTNVNRKHFAYINFIISFLLLKCVLPWKKQEQNLYCTSKYSSKGFQFSRHFKTIHPSQHLKHNLPGLTWFSTTILDIYHNHLEISKKTTRETDRLHLNPKSNLKKGNIMFEISNSWNSIENSIRLQKSIPSIKKAYKNFGIRGKIVQETIVIIAKINK